MVKVTNRLALSRDLVIRSAISYVDENGLPALTMRRLGHSLGVEAMSLYRYVNGREDLLESMVEHLVQSLRLTPGQAEALGDWPAYLNWLANAVRSIAVDHPQVFPLIATRHPSAPWLRPPLRSRRLPAHSHLVRLLRRARRRRLPGILQLPARPPAPRGDPAIARADAGRGADGHRGR
jgi:AcrR family transcriptional regulator